MAQPQEALRNLGWSKLEANCYCALVRYGEMKASEIASHIEARQEKVYQPLRQLQSEGYILIQDEGPQRYKAQNPRFVIGQERSHFEIDTDEILQNLQEAWEHAEEGLPTAGEHAWVLSGKEGLRTEQAKLIAEAENSIVGFDNALQVTPPYVMDEFEDSMEKGVSLRLVGNEPDRLSRLSTSGGDCKELSDSEILRNPSFYISDGTRVLLKIAGGKATVVFEDEYFAGITLEQFESYYNQGDEVTNEP